ncbi:beta-hexosaminidase [Exidia glandulosa HHB12029]|uniref:Beta-hexosaminidase n=1 Tax=Exidia glandulosa HHB12029 TaxID=1314781 RepID=A0A165HW99_EXIGL|nr:beta-hexosaminidase [Exidia glandulosa HHB12029]
MVRVVALVVAVFVAEVAALWPAPRQLQKGSSALRLSSAFSINVKVPNAPGDLHDAAGRAAYWIKNEKMERLVVGRGAADAKAVAASKWLSGLNVVLAPGALKALPIASESVKAVGTRDEGYTLTIPATGAPATLSANTTLGLLRGLTTFQQLWFVHGSDTYMLGAPMTITDAPAFPYRGFMLDTARNFYPVADIKRTLDVMSLVKLNVFHWHIVDSQSFPLVVPSMPELSSKGAYGSSMVYTPADIADISKYAAVRGIDIMLEIDTPGHTSVISQAHPEFVACPGFDTWQHWANEPPPGQLRLANTSVIDFTSKLFKAVASQLPGKLFSTGGDEINAACYTEDAVTQAALKASGLTFSQALQTFTDKTHATLRGIGKTPAVWEEMVLDNALPLPKDTVVLVWISSQNVASVASKGYRIVHAASDFFYLDCGLGGWVGDCAGCNSWCEPYKTWQKIYSFDPFNGTTADQAHLVLGGEALLWSEQTDAASLDDTAWPRGITQAEVFWTGANGSDGKPRSGQEALPRLHDIRFRLVQRGVRARALQPLYCALRDGVCDLNA